MRVRTTAPGPAVSAYDQHCDHDADKAEEDEFHVVWGVREGGRNRRGLAIGKTQGSRISSLRLDARCPECFGSFVEYLNVTHPVLISMTSSSDCSLDSADREITSVRVFDASTGQVFQAWTDPAILALWWGPKDFKNTFEVFEPRPGGDWKFVMHGPDGTDYKNESVFREIERPSRIVLDHISSPRFQIVATFVAEADKTKLSFRMIFETAEMRDRVKGVVVNANEQNFDRLAEQLRRMRA